jgi:hypothetical protein
MFAHSLTVAERLPYSLYNYTLLHDQVSLRHRKLLEITNLEFLGSRVRVLTFQNLDMKSLA